MNDNYDILNADKEKIIMNAVLFCRVSSKEQELEGYSLPAQEKYLREYAERNNLHVVKVFAVSESASGKKQRKVFNEMIVYVRKYNIPVIVAESTDRVTRNFADVPTIDRWILERDEYQLHLAKEGCILHRNSKSHEWFMWRVKVATAEYYVRLLSENVKKGQKEKLSQGWLPTVPPPGYRTVGDKGHRIHEIDEKIKPLIIKMFNFYDSGKYSLKQLTKKMAKVGLRNRNGNKIVMSRIHQLLQDPFYIGKNRWNGVVTDGEHPAIIDKAVFERVQRRLHSKGNPRYSKHLLVFNKVFTCKECGGTISWETHKGITYGHCNNYKIDKCTQRIWYKEKAIEQLLSKEFAKLEIKNPHIVEWLRKALKEGHKDEQQFHKASMEELNKQYQRVQKRLSKLYDDKVDEKITQEFHDEKYKEYTAEKDKILEQQQKHANASNKFHELGVNLFELSQRAQAIYLKSKVVENRRMLIALVFSTLQLQKDTISVTYTPAFRLLSELVELTNQSSKMKKTEILTARIYEPKEKVDITMQIGDFSSHPPIWLRD